MSCLPCFIESGAFSKLAIGQKIRVKAGCGFPRVRKEEVLVIYEKDRYSLITTNGTALMAREMSHITPLDEVVSDPQLENDLARKRYARFELAVD